MRLIFLFLSIIISITPAITAEYRVIDKADTAKQAMVVAANSKATAIGIEILKKGGNAVDAAVAMAFVIGVVEPHASGLGGGGGMLIYQAETKSMQYIDYYMQSPENPDTSFSSRTDIYTPRSICIPGTPAGLLKALELYGKLPLTEVIEPAIQIAKRGFIVSDKFYTNILDKLEVITLYPETQQLFFEDDFPVAAGDTLHLPSLAAVLEKISKDGLEYFYRGEFAKTAVQSIQENGGFISTKDFANYQPILKTPVHIDYHGYNIFSAPPPQSGTTLLQILNLFKETKVDRNDCFLKDDSSIHFLCEAIKRADIDRYFYLADPNQIEVPITGLLSKDYTRNRFNDIDPFKLKYMNNRDIPPGNPWQFEDKKQIKIQKNLPEDGQHTTHISVVDPEGNAVSLTQTLGMFFGSGFSSQGVIFNSAMSVFYEKPSPNHIRPNTRPLTTISPSIITQDDKLFAVIGTPGGGRIFNVLAQVIIRLLDYGFTPVQAMNAPRFSTRISSKALKLESGFSENIIGRLKEMGYTIDIIDRFSSYFGGVQMIIYNPDLMKYIGVSDPRRDGGALGY